MLKPLVSLLLLFFAASHTLVDGALQVRQAAEAETSATDVAEPSASGSASEPTGSGGTTSQVVGYWSNWRQGFSPMEEIPYKDLTILHYFVATVNLDGSIVSDRPDEIKGFVDAAHVANPSLLVSLSLFGWSGSVNASAVLKDPTSRKAFIDNLVETVTTNGLDALEIDWEYPGPNEEQGTICNTRDAGDVENFKTFLTEAKAALPDGFKFMAAVSAAGPWYETAEAHATDLSAFAPLLDLILIMTYDVVGGWSEVSGPNSPLSVKDCTDPAGLASIGKLSVEDAVAAWIAAKYPANQLLVGLASYGRGFATGPSTPASEPTGIEAPGASASEPAAITSSSSSASGDTLPAPPLFRRAEEAVVAANLFLPQTGLLQGDNFTQPNGEKQIGDRCPDTEATDTGTFLFRTLAEYAAPEWVDNWDECTATPFLTASDGSQLISYDNPRSICEKMKFVKEQGLAGVAIFDLAGLDEAGAFLDAVIKETEDCSTLSSGSATGIKEKKVDDPDSDADADTSGSGSGAVSGGLKPTGSPDSDDAASDGEDDSDSISMSSGAGGSTNSLAAFLVSQVLAAFWCIW